jgi:deoxyadenosine/deoxycytidine kinase
MIELVIYYHEVHGHCNAMKTLELIRKIYWIPMVQYTIHNIIALCTICEKKRKEDDLIFIKELQNHDEHLSVVMVIQSNPQITTGRLCNLLNKMMSFFMTTWNSYEINNSSITSHSHVTGFLIKFDKYLTDVITWNTITDLESAVCNAIKLEFVVMLRNLLLHYKTNKPKRKVIHFEGTIGAGKTTLMKTIYSEYKCNILEESLIKWQHIKSTTSLTEYDGLKIIYDLIHSKTPSYKLALIQSYIMTTIASKLINDSILSNTDTVTLMERSIGAAYHIFCETHLHLGLSNQTENNFLQQYKQKLEEITSKVAIPTGIIYLNYSADIHEERILRRGRSVEKYVSKDDLKFQIFLHKNWFSKNFDVDNDVPIVVVENASLSPFQIALQVGVKLGLTRKL